MENEMTVGSIVTAVEILSTTVDEGDMLVECVGSVGVTVNASVTDVSESDRMMLERVSRVKDTVTDLDKSDGKMLESTGGRTHGGLVSVMDTLIEELTSEDKLDDALDCVSILYDTTNSSYNGPWNMNPSHTNLRRT